MDLASLLTLALLALFLAAQPWSLLAAILLVTSQRGVVKEVAYATGWVSALAVVAVVTVLVYPGVPNTSAASTTRAAVELALGVVLGGWLGWRWRHPKDAGTDSQPAWMGRLDTMSPLLAFALGAFLPTYAVVVAAVTEMHSSGLSQGWLAVCATAWVLLASAGVSAPLVVLAGGRDRAERTYRRGRTWIVAHSRAVLYTVGGLVCAVLVVKGLVGLLG